MLAALAVAFFLRAHFPPDYRRDHAIAAEDAAGDLHVQDFAFHFNYARRAVGRPGVSPYSVEEQRSFIRAWLGSRIGSALCFAYSPTVVLLFSPLFALSTPWAWLAWNIGSAWLAAWAVRRGAGADRRLLTLGRVALINPNALYCLALGQTALFTTGLLIAMLLVSRRGWVASTMVATCVFLLTMKPPLAVVAGAALLAAGRWSSLATATAGTLLVLAAAVGWWGTGLIGDYVTLISHYTLVQADPVFRAGFVPGLMSNLRNVLLHVSFDDARASAVSSVVLVVALAVPALLAAARRRRFGLEIALAWTATSYALFSPHLSSTEDLVLLVVMLALWRAGDVSRRLRLLSAALCVAPQFLGGSAALVFGSGPGGAAAGVLPLLAFTVKLALGGVVAVGLLPVGRRA